MDKIGILGGTFDPIHLGHIMLAKKAAEYIPLDRVLLVPGGILPHKNAGGMESARHRLCMVRLALEDHPQFEVNTYEMEKNTVCYTVDTLRHFQAEYPKSRLYFIGGSDILFDLPEWKDTAQILSLCKLLIFTRSREYDRILEQAEKIRADYDASIYLFLENIPDISSTHIRGVLQSGQNCTGLLDEKVLRYIRENHLYKTQETGI